MSTLLIILTTLIVGGRGAARLILPPVVVAAVLDHVAYGTAVPLALSAVLFWWAKRRVRRAWRA